MSYEMLVGLFVVDPEKFAHYRSEIAPLLAEMGAHFRYDVEVARVLKSETNHDINRLFVLQFPDRSSQERFFQDPRYLEIRSRLRDHAVRGITVISEFAT